MLSISVYIYLSLSISTYICLCLSISVYIYLSLSLSISIYLYLFLSISIYFFLSLSIISIYIYLYLSISWRYLNGLPIPSPRNSQLWQRFQNASAALARRRGSVPGCTQVEMLDGSPETGHVKTSHWCCGLWLRVCLKKCGIARNRGIQRFPSNWQLGHQIAGIQQFDDPAASTSNWRRVPAASRLVVLCSFYLNSTPFQVQVEEP